MLNRLAGSVRDTSTAKVIAYVDEDQEEIYREACVGVGETLKIHVGPRIGPAQSANAIVKKFPDFDVYGLITDDSYVITPSWDRWMIEVVQQLPKRIGVISPWHNQGNHVDMPFVTKEWIALTGWFAYPRFFHYCWPILTGLIGEMTAIVHAPQQRFGLVHEFEMHTNTNRAPEDYEVFFEAVALRLPVYVEKIREALSE